MQFDGDGIYGMTGLKIKYLLLKLITTVPF